MKNLFAIFVLTMTSSQALALSCEFTTECMETDACQDTAFNASIDFPNHIFSTDFGDLDVVAISKTPSLLSVFARGEGANYMLTVHAENARLETHLTDGPMSIGYSGTCKDD